MAAKGAGRFDEWGWLASLSEAELSAFTSEFVRVVRESATRDDWSAIEQLLVEWKATAAILADPELRIHLTGPIEGDFGPVTMPAAST